MSTFIDRERELRDLNAVLERHTGQFLLMSGRRRVGKTHLLLHWAQQADEPYIYWLARRESEERTKQNLANTLWAYGHPHEEDPEAPQFGSWERIFNYMDEVIGDEPTIVIFDEFPYAVESDASLPSYLQGAWDHLFQDKPITLVLSGSHISMMAELRQHDAPLYGRFTGQMALKPMPYRVLRDFFPQWSAVERVAVYSIVGGIPAYLRQFDPHQSLNENIRRHLYESSGFFRSEPMTIISDLIRTTTTNYESVLRAIAEGAYTHTDIANAAGLPTNQLSPYLQRLRELSLIQRDIPATIPPKQRQSAKRGRYSLSDPFLRFYYRFVEPNLHMIQLEMVDLLWERIREQFRAFVGETGFEELSREWVRVQALQQNLPFLPEIIGSHWSSTEQIDVVALNWRDNAILLGECKWGDDVVRRPVIRELIRKTPRVVPDSNWDVYYAFFGRNGFTDAARTEARSVDTIAFVDLEQLDQDLSVVV